MMRVLGFELVAVPQGHPIWDAWRKRRRKPDDTEPRICFVKTCIGRVAEEEIEALSRLDPLAQQPGRPERQG